MPGTMIMPAPILHMGTPRLVLKGSLLHRRGSFLVCLVRLDMQCSMLGRPPPRRCVSSECCRPPMSFPTTIPVPRLPLWPPPLLRRMPPLKEGTVNNHNTVNRHNTVNNLNTDNRHNMGSSRPNTDNRGNTMGRCTSLHNQQRHTRTRPHPSHTSTSPHRHPTSPCPCPRHTNQCLRRRAQPLNPTSLPCTSPNPLRAPQPT
mmetsp:Transcript_9757/g.15987  ORF Transcript_9757/g.15987 Transcript_9757/m.15987 type:complete len:202 (+) Transcript_9757:1620-2225(+)